MSKTWFITGASSGFGRELAELLLQRGDRVAATVRKPDALKDLAAQYGERLWVAILDVTHSSAVRRVIDRAFSELQRIDVVVSNAGYALFGALLATFTLIPGLAYIAFRKPRPVFHNRPLLWLQNGFRQTLELRPEDGPSKFYLAKLDELRTQTLAEDWATHTVLREK